MNPTVAAITRASHRGGGGGGCVASSVLLSLLALPLLLLLSSSLVDAAGAGVAGGGEDGQSSSASKTSRYYDATTTRRERNLDHWDSETLAAYLGIDPTTAVPLPSIPPPDDPESPVDRYPGHDAAVMFYAQWDKNSHAIAPLWDAVATHVRAGTKESKLIMALFDCEKDANRVKLCSAAGVTHYPTLMFVGSGPYRDVDPITKTIFGKDRSAGPAGSTTLARTVKFQGNFQYGDEILDWIRTMQGLSSWHALTESGPMRFVRDGIFGLFGRNGRAGRGKKGAAGGKHGGGMSLPVGVPPTLGAGGGGGGGGLSKAQADEIEARLEKAREGEKSMKKVATHASYLIDALLFPPSPTDATATDKEYTDPFEYLTASDGWNAKVASTLVDDPKSEKKEVESSSSTSSGTPENQVLRYCLIELSLDYCTRVNTHVTNDYLDTLVSIPDDQFPSYLQIEQQLKDMVNETEPFCEIYNDCVLDDFTKEECRPKVCPYRRDVACRYMASCFEEHVVDEYAAALGIVKEGESLKKKPKAGGEEAKSGGGGGAAKGNDPSEAATATSAEGKDAKKAKKPQSGEETETTVTKKKGWGMK